VKTQVVTHAGPTDPDIGTGHHPRPAESRSLVRQIAPPVAAGSAFLAIQAALATYNVHQLQRAADAGSFGGLLPASASLSHVLVVSLTLSATVYAGLVASELAIVKRGYGVVWAVPTAILVLLPIFSPLGQLQAPHPVGIGWALRCLVDCRSVWFANPWVGSFTDLVLLMVPGVMVVRKSGRRRWSGARDAASIGAVGLTIALALIVGRTAAVLGIHAEVAPFAATVAFGVLCGIDRRWPWAHILFAAAAGGFIAQALTQGGLRSFALPASELPLGEFWLFLAAVVVASAWEPLAPRLRRLEARPAWLAVGVIVLNTADAIMTEVGVRSGGATELNPIVRTVGLPAKLLLVPLAVWLLYRWRPSVLLWPFVILAGVVCYHLTGLVVNG
jgi:hypothetical protein